MKNKIPSSLNWLINKRARLDGEIKRTEKALKRVQSLVTKLRELEEALKAVDYALTLHEIKIDVENIKPIKPHRNRSKFAKGEIKNLILKYLRANNDGQPILKSKIQEHINVQHLLIDPVPLRYRVLSDCVISGLNRLHAQGHVIRCQQSSPTTGGSWKAK